MTEPRRKNPEAVRGKLMESAVALAIGHGLPAVTVDAVAQAAGVTKGALFHHFPNKQALVAAVFAQVVADLDADIAALMAADPEPHGRFTRAYLDSAFTGTPGEGAVLWLSAVTDPDLARLWSDWLADRLRCHAATDVDCPAATRLEAVRLATDGICYGRETAILPKDPSALHDWLRAQTFA